MRLLSLITLVSTLAASPAYAATGGEGGGLMALRLSLMFWTLLIFLILFFILKKFAFGPITAAVEARERALEEAKER